MTFPGGRDLYRFIKCTKQYFHEDQGVLVGIAF
jgi:hypothetical protein